MDPTEIQQLLQSAIENCDAQIQLEGSHVHLVVVSPAFEGLNSVKKQQLVYAALNAAIADGRIHAVHMKTYTPSEWQQAQ